IVDLILAQTLENAETSYREVYQRHGPLLRSLKEMEQPLPEVLKITAEFVLNSDLRQSFEAEPVDSVRVATLMDLVKQEGVKLEEAGLSFAAGKSLTRLMQRLEQDPRNVELLERADVLTTLLQVLPLPVNYWKAQNIFYSMLQQTFPFIA